MSNEKNNNLWGTHKWMAIAIVMLMSSDAYCAVVTNKDVISLLEAGMPEDVVIQAITSGEPKFDTSAAALIKLKEKGATPAVLKAVLAPKGGSDDKRANNDDKKASHDDKKGNRGGKTSTSGGVLNPEDAILIVDGRETKLQYIVPGNRTGGFGFGVSSYDVLQGPTATTRLKPASLEFIVSVPKNVQANLYLGLASLVVRKNGNRELAATQVGAFRSNTIGKIPTDRVVQTTLEQLENQSRAKEGFVLYSVKTQNAVSAGEYALVYFTQIFPSTGGNGNNAPFGGMTGHNSYFDFGVD